MTQATVQGSLRLWLVRHAQVALPEGTCYGQLDVPAHAQATQSSAFALAQALPQGLDLRCSTLQRCEQLAKSLLAQRPDLTLQPDPRLRELNFGRWEGRPWGSIAKSEIDAWAQQLATHAPGGGERLTDMLARVRAALHETLVGNTAARDAVWISHAGVARCVQWLLGERAGTAPCSTQWPVRAPGPGTWAVYDISEDGRARIAQMAQAAPDQQP